jgi:hypothetical protein
MERFDPDRLELSALNPCGNVSAMLAGVAAIDVVAIVKDSN